MIERTNESAEFVLANMDETTMKRLVPSRRIAGLEQQERLTGVQERSEFAEYLFNFGLCVTSDADFRVPPLYDHGRSSFYS